MRKFFKGAAFYVAIFIVILLIVRFYSEAPQDIATLDVVQFTAALSEGEVSEVMIEGNQVAGRLQDGTRFETYVPQLMERPIGERLLTLIGEGKIGELEGLPPVQTPWFVDLLPFILLVLALVVFWFIFMQNSQGGGSKVMSFGKSKARLHKPDEGRRITFAEVAGLKEEKEEMYEIVDFLKYPKKYLDLGARIPKGILMVGPPGTGKTYLSKAVAGEAGVPFFSISGSDFVEMFVGVGASRVRDLFETAKKNAPCIVFIDEIDAVGRKRGAGLGGGHDEREQTLNQLLVEMDGFGEAEGIILIAATNRPDILDPALLRPGRFDREVSVGIPDVREREAILKIHSRNKPIGKDVDFEVIAKSTPGFTPADLENVLNEAALLSARINDRAIHMDTIKEATTKVIAGVEKKSRVVSDKERRLTAYHEAGHALLAHLLPDTDPVHQVTIIPRGRAGGFTMQLPREDRSFITKSKMEQDLVILLGGRVAEKLVLKDISTGAQNDLSRVTQIARAMITQYAMSDNLSSMSYENGEEVFLGKDMTTRRNYSEQVASEIDIEIRRTVDDAFNKANELLEENIEKLHVVAKALLEYETISGEEFETAVSEGLEALKVMVEEGREKKEQERQRVREREEAEKLAYEALLKAKKSGQEEAEASQEEPQEPHRVGPEDFLEEEKETEAEQEQASEDERNKE